jgi:hypothetical protein
MDQQQDQEEENQMMLEMNIKQFIEAAREYFFGMLPAQPKLATIPVRTVR